MILSGTPTLGGIVARIHTDPQQAGHDIVVVKIGDSKGKEDLFVQADALQLASRLH